MKGGKRRKEKEKINKKREIDRSIKISGFLNYFNVFTFSRLCLQTIKFNVSELN